MILEAEATEVRSKTTEVKGGDSGEIAIRPVTKNDWHNIEALFGERGACGGCWCMWWRVPHGGKLWEESKGAKNRESLRRLLRSGELHAVMAFAGEAPIAWCSFGPRSTFPRLETVRALKRDFQEGAWSIVCFYINSKWRRHGIGTRLLEAATARAFELGATEIEGYPVVAKKTGSAIPAAFAWTGVPPMFVSAGYTSLEASSTRPIFIRRSRVRRNTL